MTTRSCACLLRGSSGSPAQLLAGGACQCSVAGMITSLVLHAMVHEQTVYYFFGCISRPEEQRVGSPSPQPQPLP